MNSDVELRRIETERRNALWALAGIPPGDSKALDALDVLGEIEQRERLGSTSMEKPLSIEQVQRLVTIEPHSIGCSIVRELNSRSRGVSVSWAQAWDRHVSRKGHTRTIGIGFLSSGRMRCGF